MVTSYVMVKKPDCFSNFGLQSANTKTASTNNATLDRPTTPVVVSTTIVTPATPPPTPVPAPKAAPAPLLPVNIPQCSADQMASLLKQLPKEGCDKPAWSQSCSFTIATAKSGCQDTTAYFRQPLASMSLQDPFRAIIVGTKDDEIIVDLLQLATHDTTKYDVEKWGKIVGMKSCLPPRVTFTGTPQTAKIMVLEPDMAKAMKVKRWKTEMGLSNDDLRGETTRITNSTPGEGVKSLTTWASTEVPTGPIHFLRMDSEADYEVLYSGAGQGGVLERVWYLEFQFHWQARWKEQQLKDIINDTLKDFACYWKGGKGNLWRMTGCWQDHYGTHSWSYVACVNVRIEAAKPIAQKMEQVFQNTLSKDQSFHE